MLYIDETEKKSAKDMFDWLVEKSGKKVNVTFSQLSKHPVFTVNPIMGTLDIGRSRQRGTNIKKIGLGTDILAYFKVDDDGVERTIRYTRVNIYNDQTTGRPIYSPRNLEINPVEHEAANAEIAVMLFFNPLNADSPFHVEGKNYKFEYQNQNEEAQKKLNKGTQLKDALNSIDTIDDLDLVFFAKGLGISDAENMDKPNLIGELTEKAIENPAYFLKKREEDSVIFNGRIMKAVDDGHIKYTNNGWFFTKGINKGQVICQVPRGTTDTLEYLITYIGINIKEYHQEILSLTKSVQSSKNVDDYLRQVKEGAIKTELPKQPSTVELADIKDFNSAEKFLAEQHELGNKPPKKKTSDFLKAYGDGLITEENLQEELPNYMAK